MPVDLTIRGLIGERADAPEIFKAATSEGMVTLRECAIKKMAHGVTTFEEVMGVITQR